ncbi:MAG: hypothetical protein HXS48_09255 [Theionarchaea archaeon]|nr:hypothetical protein [Theionarchaea archaeon]
MKRVLALLLMVLFLGCQRPETNLLENPSFEEGEEPWFWIKTSVYWQGFHISDQTARTGGKSCLTFLEASPQPQGTLVVGAVQEIVTSDVPEKVSGYYYVKTWEKTSETMYIQVVVIFFQEEDYNSPSTQLRYILAGISKRPFAIENAKFIFVTREEPETGKWIYFERNLKEDLINMWGEIPSFKRIGIYLEVRYDSVPLDVIKAEVYWDDIFVG